MRSAIVFSNTVNAKLRSLRLNPEDYQNIAFISNGRVRRRMGLHNFECFLDGLEAMYRLISSANFLVEFSRELKVGWLVVWTRGNVRS